ncbi:DUF6600 domain-containing protein [Dokdonella sp. MW10]|uniref:DUF6600 domain-containing protein n=1 Tax=Dokdonella sp. MW10 TaxID=2992926 RepID=UPI003F7D5EEB
MAGLALALCAGTAAADPPGRVARLSYLGGNVSFQPAGVDEWTEASLNRPLSTGDGLYADRNSRVELEVGAATLRLDERSAFNVLNLDDDFMQVELTEGVLNLRVHRIFQGQTYEIDTPTLAFVIDEPGQYRVDIAPDGASTMVTVFDGRGDVYGENNASYAVRGGQSYRFNDSSLRDYEIFDLPREDDFDRWCYERDERYERSESRRYVSEEIIGYSDLDRHGSWRTVDTYGSVWFPSSVAADWAPYRSGRWSWIDPWGWTWVDTAPWGFAPYHYGRWTYVSNRWGWVPGPRHVRPVYAPALVAFVGGRNFSVGVSIGGGGPVGWFPLGPRDVYVPWYRGSRDYFTNINVRNTTIINNTYITNVYGDYSAGRPINNFRYTYRDNDRAYTAIPRDAFVQSRAVNAARMQVDRQMFARGDVISRVDVAPVRASFVGRAEGGRAAVRPPSGLAQRQVIARAEPPPRVAPVQTRLGAIERNGNQPLAVSEMRQLGNRGAAASQPGRVSNERVRVVGRGGEPGAAPQPLPNRAAVSRGDGERPGVESRVTRAAPGASPERTSPAQRGVTRETAPSRVGNAGAAPNERALPSSRFAPERGNARQVSPGSSTPERSASPSRSPVERTTPIQRQEIERGAPGQRQSVERSAPTQRQSIERSAPQQAAPAQRVQREATQQRQSFERSAPQQAAPAQRVQREAPQQRQSFERSAPQQAAPVQRVQREAPQQRQSFERSAPQQAAPVQRVQREAPQQRQAAPQAQPQQQQQQQRSAPNRQGNNEERSERKRRDER